MTPYNPELSIIEQYSAATVIGLGATGFSAVRHLRARGLTVRVLDSREQPALTGRLQQQFPEVELLA